MLPPYIRQAIVRLVIALLVILGGLAAGSAVDSFISSQLLDKLDVLSRNSAWQMESWQDQKINRAAKLATDSRLLEVYEDSTLDAVQTIRRTLYEFSYLNEIKNVYVYNIHQMGGYLKTAEAPDLAPNLPAKLDDFIKEKKVADIFISQSGDAHYIVTAMGIPTATGTIVGYALILEPVSEAFSSLIKPRSKDLPSYHLDIYHRIHEGKYAEFAAVNWGAPKLEFVLNQDTPLPLYKEEPVSDAYSLPIGLSFLASLVPVSDYPSWKVVAKLPAGELAKHTMPYKVVIWIGVSVILILLLIAPLQDGRSPTKVMVDKARKALGLPPLFKEAPIGYAEKSKEDTPPPPVQKPVEKAAPFEETEEEPEPPTPKKQKVKVTQEDPEQVRAEAVRKNLNAQRIKLLYQPIVHANTDKNFMHEVYLRVFDEFGNMIPPAEFFPLAHKYNFLEEIDLSVIHSTIDKHFSLGSQRPPTPLAINLSGGTFDSIRFLETVIANISNNKLDVEGLVFELQSQEMIQDKRGLDFMRECREVGLRFSVDYFGGGVEALRAAKALKFDYVKINALNYEDLQDNVETQKELVRLALTAKNLELPLILEKVETYPMIKFAKKIGIPYLQGYAIAKPKEDFSID